MSLRSLAACLAAAATLLCGSASAQLPQGTIDYPVGPPGYCGQIILPDFGSPGFAKVYGSEGELLHVFKDNVHYAIDAGEGTVQPSLLSRTTLDTEPFTSAVVSKDGTESYAFPRDIGKLYHLALSQSSSDPTAVISDWTLPLEGYVLASVANAEGTVIYVTTRDTSGSNNESFLEVIDLQSNPPSVTHSIPLGSQEVLEPEQVFLDESRGYFYVLMGGQALHLAKIRLGEAGAPTLLGHLSVDNVGGLSTAPAVFDQDGNAFYLQLNFKDALLSCQAGAGDDLPEAGTSTPSLYSVHSIVNHPTAHKLILMDDLNISEVALPEGVGSHHITSLFRQASAGLERSSAAHPGTESVFQLFQSGLLRKYSLHEKNLQNRVFTSHLAMTESIVIENIRFLSHTEGSVVQFGIYSKLVSEADYQMVWQSEPTTTTLGEMTIPTLTTSGTYLYSGFAFKNWILGWQQISGDPAIGHCGTWVGLAGTSGGCGGLQHRTTLNSIGMPDTFPMPNIHEEYGEWALSVERYYQLPPTMSGIGLVGSTSRQTSKRLLELEPMGSSDAEFVDISEDEGFANSIRYPIGTGSVTFELSDKDGPHRIYARVGNSAGLSETRSLDVFLDRQPPLTPEKPVADEGAVTITERITYRWRTDPPRDPQPSSGIAKRELIVGTSPGAENVANFKLESDYNTIYVGHWGGALLYASVRNHDNAGNTGEWSETSEPVKVDRRPEVKGLTISPANPRTNDDLSAQFEVSDPDGDPISTVETYWVRLNDFETTGTTLSHTLTQKDETWQLRVRAYDVHGMQNMDAHADVVIANSPPTQPIVQILPRTPSPDEDLIVDVMQYSTDADGDFVAYDFRWYKSTDNGATWVRKVELDGSPQVTHLFINDGELWRVEYIPYEKIDTAPRGAKQARVEGRPAIDQVYIGSNNTPPALTLAQPTAVVGSEAVKLTVDWQSSDAEGDACTVDLYWTDKQSTDLITVAENLDAVRGTHFAAIPNLPIDRPVYIHAIARDSKGAVTQVTSSAVRLNQDPESEITAILTGEIPGDPAADANNDETLDAADVTTRINDGGPDPTR